MQPEHGRDKDLSSSLEAVPTASHPPARVSRFKKNFWRQRPNKKIVRYVKRKYREKFNAPTP